MNTVRTVAPASAGLFGTGKPVCPVAMLTGRLPTSALQSSVQPVMPIGSSGFETCAVPNSREANAVPVGMLSTW